jgi:hypothetical protein
MKSLELAADVAADRCATVNSRLTARQKHDPADRNSAFGTAARQYDDQTLSLLQN